MQYEIRQQSERRFVIVDSAGQQTRGRFHTAAEAQGWIDAKRVSRVLALCFPDSQYGSRARAHLLTSRDYYSENERSIQRLSPVRPAV